MIPPYLNIPLVTWLWLRGRCANCQAPITIRYFLVEALTRRSVCACWLRFGHSSALLALAYCVLLAAFSSPHSSTSSISSSPTKSPSAASLWFCCFRSGARSAQRVGPLTPPYQEAWWASCWQRHGLSDPAPGQLLFGRQNVELKPNTRIMLHRSGADPARLRDRLPRPILSEIDTLSWKARRLNWWIGVTET